MRNLLLVVLVCTVVSLDVGRCDLGNLAVLPLSYIDGTADSTTTASVCYDDTHLYVLWRSVDVDIVSNYTMCNDPLWKQDVVEVFIASPNSYPTNYFEF